MGTRILIGLILGVFSIGSFGWAVEPSNTAQNQQALDKAKQDYRVFLSRLKELNSEYKQLTGQIAQVVREEGVPAWDSNTDSLTFTKELSGAGAASQEGVRIKEDDKEMNVSVDLPGLKKSSIKASIEDVKVLKINAVRNMGQEVLPVERIVKLPAAAQEQGTQANYEDGVLTVKIPKAAKKEITVPIR